MKKIKLISSLCALIITIACLTIGVYSAVKTSFTASGSITFNAFNLNIDLQCKITGLAPGKNGADENGEKTLYGTTFITCSNSVDAERTKYIDGSSIKDGVTDLSIQNAVVDLGNLEFNELNVNENAKNIISLEFTFANYSDYIVKAEAKSTVDAADKMTIQNGGAIMNKYVSGKTEHISKFTIFITPVEGAAALTESENGFSISISVSPDGLRTNTAGTQIYDTSVCEQTLYDIANNVKQEGLGNLTWNEYCEQLEWNKFSKNDPDGVKYVIKNGVIQVTLPYLEEASSAYFYFAKYKDDLTIVQEVFGKQVESFDDAPPFGARNIKGNCTLPNGLKSIGDCAFVCCGNATSFVLPNSLTTIGQNVFFECDGLTTFVFPEKTTSIGNLCLSDCSNLTTVTINGVLEYIGGSIFESCNNLSSVKITNMTKEEFMILYSDCGTLPFNNLNKNCVVTFKGGETF